MAKLCTFRNSRSNQWGKSSRSSEARATPEDLPPARDWPSHATIAAADSHEQLGSRPRMGLRVFSLGCRLQRQHVNVTSHALMHHAVRHAVSIVRDFALCC